MLFLFLILLSLYVLLIGRYIAGWYKIESIRKESFCPNVSVVIAIRNEEDKIPRLIRNLGAQMYPVGKLEFILINDHSSDSTVHQLEACNLDNLRIVNMPDGKSGKKSAISMGVALASGDIILASDADCYFSVNWVRCMTRYFANENIKLVSGPVDFNRYNGFFHKLQVLEFLSLIASGAGAIGIHKAIFCNGANMAYRKETFIEVNGFNDDTIVSGDDVFLLHNIKAKYPESIAFAKDRDAIVTTNSPITVKEFVNQRKRWAAKSSAYQDSSSVYASYLVLLTNVSFIVLLGMLFFDSSLFFYFLIFYVSKFSVDLFLLYPVLNFFNRKELIKWIFPFEIFYSIYIILIVILSFSTKFEWKGREYRK